jgi:predicted transcriptional regulator
LLDLNNIAKVLELSMVLTWTLNSRERKEMMKRSKHVIVSQILDICKDGACKTKIVYQANLNFRTVNPYINLLVKNNLLTVKPGKNVMYETTDRGIKLLDEFEQINTQLSES